jgi:hypothetical protein
MLRCYYVVSFLFCYYLHHIWRALLSLLKEYLEQLDKKNPYHCMWVVECTIAAAGHGRNGIATRHGNGQRKQTNTRKRVEKASRNFCPFCCCDFWLGHRHRHISSALVATNGAPSFLVLFCLVLSKSGYSGHA